MSFKGRRQQSNSLDANDTEENLLDTKRRRLLRQSDWAGLTRPKLLMLNFQAQRGRDEIGKRRKTSHHNALTMHEDPSRLVPLPEAGTRRQLGGGARQHHDIKVRIGSDALTNRTTVHTSPQAQASATWDEVSSEEMTSGNAALHRAAPKPGQQADPNARRFVGAPTHALHPRNSTWGVMPRNQQLHYVGGSAGSMRVGLNEDSNASPNDQSVVSSSAEDHVSANKRGEVSNYCITQQVEGTTRSLRLTFDAATEFSAMAPIENASSCNLIGESNHNHYTANAAVTESGHVQMEAGAAGNAEPRPPHDIDEGPWMTFLPVQANSSSLSVADDLSALNRAHDRPAIHPLSNSASWSQRATQGARALADASLCVSPCLPSITQKCEKDELREHVHAGPGRSERSEKHIDGNDEFWQRLVFGSDKLDSTDGRPEATSPDKVIMDERRIVPFVAVSRSSTPFDPLHGPGFCVSDSTQAAATRAPLVTSSGSMLPIITSSTAPRSR
ncbi:uncharacterized protein CC84DRAFT_439352 [Paraphaeosphaeria sporulosa]|uniref:Uncharacterized protein n=1 Tax=Paraphaeosphaeria sporulosa TaxID=1460663 RepID=A0A177CRW9_9PLEO|nr:uncharacterized protein CC84DRAFT_439352 [Paraphaeosphaeria sporulosa]OAG09509.1 hypothetical protein CC84DRAFT_439352 [Paraphaeosphaeria sporulosa]